MSFRPGVRGDIVPLQHPPPLRFSHCHSSVRGPVHIVYPKVTNSATSASFPPHCSYAKTGASLLQAASGALLVPRAAFSFTTLSHSLHSALPPPSLNRHSRTAAYHRARLSFPFCFHPYLTSSVSTWSFPSSCRVPACSAVQNRRFLGQFSCWESYPPH